MNKSVHTPTDPIREENNFPDDRYLFGDEETKKDGEEKEDVEADEDTDDEIEEDDDDSEDVEEESEKSVN